jgi:hypothetical protein
MERFSYLSTWRDAILPYILGCYPPNIYPASKLASFYAQGKTKQPDCSTFKGMPIVRRMFLLLVLSVILSGCNVVLSRAPGVHVLDKGLGTYDDRPTWFWEVYGPDLVQGFRYSIGSETDWVEVVDEVRTYKPLQALAAGEHTLFLQAKSASGLWSQTVSATAEVETASPYTPSDPYFSGTMTDSVGQWALNVIKTPELWGYLRGIELSGTQRSEIVVAVIDTGYTDHPDLLQNLLVSEGYDFVLEDTGDGDGIDADATDPGDGDLPLWEHSWHGTGVSGVIAALTDNGGVGIAGIGLSNLKVLPIRALGEGGGTTYDIAQAIRYAAGLPNDSGQLPTRPAKVINLSIGAYVTSDPYVEPALEEAAAAGVIVVASAGNERGSPYYETEAAYPASSPFTIAVAATTASHSVAPYSNPGETLDIAAPGGLGDDDQHPDYTDTWFDWVITASPDFARDQPLAPTDYTYAGIVGTSIAAPHVAGILALLCTVNDSMDLAMAKEVLRRSAVDLGVSGWDRDFGHGLLDALAAIGEYNLMLATGWAAASTRGIAGELRLAPQEEPSGELAKDSLIVRYKTATSAKSLDAHARLLTLGVTHVRPAVDRDQLLRPRADSEPTAVRRALLEEPNVESVYFNYVYKPLTTKGL